jgi:hypothetical protein
MFFQQYVSPSGEPLPLGSAQKQSQASPGPSPEPGPGVLFRVLELQLPDGTKQTIIDDVNHALVKPVAGLRDVDKDFVGTHLPKVSVAAPGTWGSHRMPLHF